MVENSDLGHNDPAPTTARLGGADYWERGRPRAAINIVAALTAKAIAGIIVIDNCAIYDRYANRL